MKKAFILLFQILCFTVARSQQATYYFKNYQVQNGLSSNTITSILQDKKGFMWYGSRNGLNRFDGNVFRLFGNKLGDTTEVISDYQFNNVNINPAWAEKNRLTVVRFLKGHIQSLRWIYDHPADAIEFLTKEFGLQTQYARKGIEYYTQKRVYPSNGDVTLTGLKANIEVQVQDGIIKGAPPPPEKFVDLSYLRQAQKELGLQ